MNVKRFTLGIIIGVVLMAAFAKASNAQWTEEYPDPCVGAMAAAPVCNVDPDPLHCSWYWTPLCDVPGRPEYPHPCVIIGTCVDPEYPPELPPRTPPYPPELPPRTPPAKPVPSVPSKPVLRATVAVVEFAHDGRYFLTAFADEIAALDAGGVWTRTGQTFNAYASTGERVCRFFFGATHLFTADAVECAAVWATVPASLEGTAFYADKHSVFGCVGGRAVFRLFADGRYRFVADAALRDALIAASWQYEGVAFCGAE